MLSFGFHASTIGYKSLREVIPSLLYLPNEAMEWTLSISLAWHWINLSHTSKGSSADKVTLYSSLCPYLSLFPSPPSLSSPSHFFPVQLTVIVSGHIASCPFIPCFSSVFLMPHYVTITLWPSGIRDACVKVIPCEKTPACSQWPPTGSGAQEALQLTLCLESTSAPSGRTEAYTDEFRLLLSLKGRMEM